MFVAVYEERSFTVAAVREHATQSGVSQHIRNLEDRLRVQLFARNKGVNPTPAGTAYYRRCLEVLKAHALARRTLEEFAIGLSGELIVGLPPTMTRAVLAPAFLRFNAKHPNVCLRVVEAYAPLLADALRAGNLDFAILPRMAAATPGLKNTLFTRTPEFLVSKAGSGLAGGAPIRLADVENLKLVLPAADNPRTRALLQYCAGLGVTIESRLEFDTVPGTLDLVSRSDWRVIFPGLVLAEEMGGGKFTVNPLANPELLLDMYLVEPERQPLSAAATAFLDELREVADEVNTEAMRLLEETAHATS